MFSDMSENAHKTGEVAVASVQKYTGVQDASNVFNVELGSDMELSDHQGSVVTQSNIGAIVMFLLFLSYRFFDDNIVQHPHYTI